MSTYLAPQLPPYFQGPQRGVEATYAQCYVLVHAHVVTVLRRQRTSRLLGLWATLEFVNFTLLCSVLEVARRYLDGATKHLHIISMKLYVSGWRQPRRLLRRTPSSRQSLGSTRATRRCKTNLLWGLSDSFIKERRNESPLNRKLATSCWGKDKGGEKETRNKEGVRKKLRAMSLQDMLRKSGATSLH